MEGVYLVAPTSESVDAIKRDFASSSESLYKKVHLFFLEAVPKDLFQSLRQCRELMSRIKTFKASDAAVQAFGLVTALSRHPSKAQVMDTEATRVLNSDHA